MNEITTRHSFRCDLNAGTLEVSLDKALMHQDALGDVFSVSVWRGSSPVELDGATVRGYLYLAATQQTVLLSGSASGSSAAVTLDSSCYAVPGHAALVIQLQKGTVRHTVLKANFVIDRTCTDTVIDPSNVLPTLPELLAQIAAMEQGTAAANAAAEAANTAAANAKEFIVTVTAPIIAGEAATADKTFAEIKTAINAGKTPVIRLKMQGKVEVDTLHLYKSGAMSIVFRQQVKHTADYNIVSALQCIFTTAGISIDSVNFRSVPGGGTDGQVLVHKGESTCEWRDPSAIAGIAPAIIPTASGSIVTITDGAARPAAEVVSHIEPAQGGSGIPRPDNVRPIGGWNKVTAKHTGRNMVSPSFGTAATGGITFTANEDGSVTITGTASSTVGQRISDNAMDVFLPKGIPAHIFLADASPNAAITLQVYIDNTSKFNAQNGYLTIPESASSAYLRIRVAAGVEINETIHPMVTLDDGTTWEAGSARILNADLPETMYGGNLNWTTGALTSTHQVKYLDGTEEWTGPDMFKDGTYRYLTIAAMASNLLVPPSNDDSPDAVCSHFSAQPYTALYNGGTVGLAFAQSRKLSIRCNFATVNEFKAYLAAQYAAGTPVTIAYPLNNPQTEELVPQQFSTLYGTNNLWSSTGDTTLSYIADTKLYIDQRIAALLNA